MNTIVFFGSSGIELHQCKRPFKNQDFCRFNKNSKYYLYDYPLYFSKYSEKSQFPAFIIFKKEIRFYKCFNKGYEYTIPLNKYIYEDIIEII